LEFVYFTLNLAYNLAYNWLCNRLRPFGRYLTGFVIGLDHLDFDNKISSAIV
jgi:hypothetical protein